MSTEFSVYCLQHPPAQFLAEQAVFMGEKCFIFITAYFSMDINCSVSTHLRKIEHNVILTGFDNIEIYEENRMFCADRFCFCTGLGKLPLPAEQPPCVARDCPPGARVRPRPAPPRPRTRAPGCYRPGTQSKPLQRQLLTKREMVQRQSLDTRGHTILGRCQQSK